MIVELPASVPAARNSVQPPKPPPTPDSLMIVALPAEAASKNRCDARAAVGRSSAAIDDHCRTAVRGSSKVKAAAVPPGASPLASLMIVAAPAHCVVKEPSAPAGHRGLLHGEIHNRCRACDGRTVEFRNTSRRTGTGIHSSCGLVCDDARSRARRVEELRDAAALTARGAALVDNRRRARRRGVVELRQAAECVVDPAGLIGNRGIARG